MSRGTAPSQQHFNHITCHDAKSHSEPVNEAVIAHPPELSAYLLLCERPRVHFRMSSAASISSGITYDRRTEVRVAGEINVIMLWYKSSSGRTIHLAEA